MVQDRGQIESGMKAEELSAVTRDIRALHDWPLPEVRVTLKDGQEMCGRLFGLTGVNALEDVRAGSVGLTGGSALRVYGENSESEIDAEKIFSVRNK